MFQLVEGGKIYITCRPLYHSLNRELIILANHFNEFDNTKTLHVFDPVLDKSILSIEAQNSITGLWLVMLYTDSQRMMADPGPVTRLFYQTIQNSVKVMQA